MTPEQRGAWCQTVEVHNEHTHTTPPSLPYRARRQECLPSMTLAVVQKGAEATGVAVVGDRGEKVLVELKGQRVLPPHLPHTVQPLQKDGRPLVLARLQAAVAKAAMKHETKRAPVLLHKHHKATQLCNKTHTRTRT